MVDLNEGTCKSAQLDLESTKRQASGKICRDTFKKDLTEGRRLFSKVGTPSSSDSPDRKIPEGRTVAVFHLLAFASCWGVHC